MAACTPSIHVFLGRPLFLLSNGIHSIINFGILSSSILLTWPYHCSLFFPIMSMMSGCPFTHIISFIPSFFVLSILDFFLLASTSISVDKILFISLLTYLITYLLNYLLTYLLAYLITCLLTYLLIYLLAYLLAYLLTYLLAYLLHAAESFLKS